MTKQKRLELLNQHITKREMILTELVMIGLYLTTALTCIPTTSFWWALLGYALLCIAFGEIRNQFLMGLNEWRSARAKEVEPEVSLDDDSE